MFLRYFRATHSEDSSVEGGSFDSFVFYVGAAIAAGSSFLVSLATDDSDSHRQNVAFYILSTSVLSILSAAFLHDAIDGLGRIAFLRIRNNLPEKRFALMTVGFLTFLAVAAVSFTFSWISWPFLKDLRLGNFNMLAIFVIVLIPLVYFYLAAAVCIRLATRIVCGTAGRTRPTNSGTN